MLPTFLPGRNQCFPRIPSVQLVVELGAGELETWSQKKNLRLVSVIAEHSEARSRAQRLGGS